MDIAVTGVGCVTPCGNDVPTFWETLLSGRSGIDHITQFPTEGFGVDIAGEVKNFDSSKAGVERKDARRLAPYVLYAMAASREALLQSGLLESPFVPQRVATIIGTGVGALRQIELEMDVLRKRGPRRVSPLLAPSGTPEVSPSEVSRLYGFKGPSFSVNSACSSGSDSIIMGARCLALGEVDVVVAGGTEHIVSELGMATFTNLGALARPLNGDPTTVSRPFDRGRKGFVMGAGAGVMVLETMEHAKRRGANILAVLCGYGQTTDAYHKTAPDPEGTEASRAMQLSMERAGVAPEEIDYVNAHGTGTQQNDPIETLVIKKAIGDHAYKVPVSSTKSMTGHMIGAAGAAEAIVVIQTVLTGNVPPTINYSEPDPECDLFYVPNEAIEASVKVAMTNSFGFGGHNSSLLFRAS